MYLLHLVVGAFFLRFWRRTADPLFAIFALAFLVLAAGAPVFIAGPVSGTGNDRLQGASTLEFGASVAAGQTVKLSPGGYHVMLIDLKQPLKAGASVPFTLTIERADKSQATVEVKAEVRDMTGAAKGARGWMKIDTATIYYDHPYYAPLDHSLNIDFVNQAAGAPERVALELSAESARELVRKIEAAGITKMAELAQQPADLTVPGIGERNDPAGPLSPGSRKRATMRNSLRPSALWAQTVGL